MNVPVSWFEEISSIKAANSFLSEGNFFKRRFNSFSNRCWNYIITHRAILVQF